MTGLDVSSQRRITGGFRVRLRRPAKRPNWQPWARGRSEIDYGDAPPLTEDFGKNAVHGRFYKPTKTSTTVRIDTDLLVWLKSQGKGYQSRINAILRRKMPSSLKG